MDLGIEFGIDKIPADGKTCTRCNCVIDGFGYYPYVAVGKPEQGSHLDEVYCLPCKIELFGEEE